MRVIIDIVNLIKKCAPIILIVLLKLLTSKETQGPAEKATASVISIVARDILEVSGHIRDMQRDLSYRPPSPTLA